jgi:FAM192A/Fyv6, N-terminal domain
LPARPIAAKQEAFEESIRLKNQFRALDEDEVEFLDSVLESTRAEEERVRRETAEGLEAFRRLQEEADKKLLANAADPVVANPAEEQVEWVAGGVRKRKRRAGEKEAFVKGVKLRKSSTSGLVVTTSTADKPPYPSAERGGMNKDVSPAATKSVSTVNETSRAQTQVSKPMTSSSSPINVATTMAPNGGLCLVDYGSDEDDD